MWKRAIIAGFVALAAHAATPSEFYIVSKFFSDNGALYYYRVIDVHSDGPDTVVRYTRVGWTDPRCPIRIVQTAEARVRNTLPGDLVKQNNPCAINPKNLHADLRRFTVRASFLESITSGIVAQCGSSRVVLRLPRDVNVEVLRTVRPELAQLWSLSSDVVDPLFGEKDVFHDRNEEDDLALQRAGEKAVPELISGRFDAGLERSTFREILEDYRGPISAAEARKSYTPQLLDAQAYQFIEFEPPDYPPLAMQARIQGKVELLLTADLETGEVVNAIAISGHSMLKINAASAAKRWRFQPNSLTSNTVHVAIDYTLHCQ